jgi:hypothetical protein
VIKKTLLSLSIFTCSLFHLLGGDFTISSYNGGGLPSNYDYLRAASMQKLIQERSSLEPELMAKAEKIQALALSILFSTDPEEQLIAQMSWAAGHYDEFLEEVFSADNTINGPWKGKLDQMLSSHLDPQVTLSDPDLKERLKEHAKGIIRSEGKSSDIEDFDALLTASRKIMAKRILKNYLKFDIICLQEADYIDEALLPDHYKAAFSSGNHSINGIVWNEQRFECLQVIGDILGRAFAVSLRDRETAEVILVASGHLTGCNPFFQVEVGGKVDSLKGDRQLEAICQLFDTIKSDIKLIAVDSNVAATHPRLNLFKQYGYQLDYNNYLEATCSNPNYILNTRIDWIGAKGNANVSVGIQNIPVLSLGLNSIETNISDHKPIAARISSRPLNP